MRFGLIGHTGHWREYTKMLAKQPQVSLVATAQSWEGESRAALEKAPGVSETTKFYADVEEMLKKEQLDIVQIASRSDLIPHYIALAARYKVAVVAEKPLAMDLGTLVRLHAIVKEAGIPVVPMHTQRGDGKLGAVKKAVAEGKIGVPLVCNSQKSYKWGGKRPDWYKSRATFSGLTSYIGIHAIDWMYWILGDVFTAVSAYGGQASFAGYDECEGQASYVFQMTEKRAATLTLDYLRPSTASTHGDGRVRIAGTAGIVENLIDTGPVFLINEDGEQELDEIPGIEWYSGFVASLRGEGEAFMSTDEGFRITEIAIKAQEALDTGLSVSLASDLDLS